MSRWLRLVPQLAHAIACMVVILIAEPILALLADRRRLHRGPDVNTNEPEPAENTPAQNALLTVAEALDAAGAPRTDTQRDGIGINLELGYVARIRWLAEQRDEKELAREKEAKEANKWAGEARQLRSDVEKTNARADLAEANLSELHINLRQALGADSVAEAFDEIAALKKARDELTKDRLFLVEQRRQADADLAEARRQRDETQTKAEDFSERYNRAADSVQALTEQRDKAAAEAEHAEGWRLACSTHERTITRLTSKVKRLESTGSGARFALTSESREATTRADIVVDAKSGKVVKNRLGRAALTAKSARAKPRTRKRA